MSSRRSASIYILTGLLLIVGILLFVFKGQILSYLSGRVFGTEATVDGVTVKASAASVIKLDILEKPQFKKLSDHVLYFDFNRVGKPVAKVTGTKVQLPSWQPVYLGNANPFLIKTETAAASGTKAVKEIKK